MIKTQVVVIEGISPLLMHSYPMVPIEAIEKKTREEQAELAAYRMPPTDDKPGLLYVPGVNVQRSLVAGAAYSKGKGRASLAKVAAACLLVTEEYLSLGTREYGIDARPVVIPATKGRVVRYRPIIREWRLTVPFQYDDSLMSAQQVRQVVDDTGKNVGLLDFRPEKKGPFGRFNVIDWKD